MRRQRFSDLETEESTDRWLVSYADFITLLFAFFVVMYSISNVNLGKYRVLSNSVMTAFSAQSNSPFPIGSQLGISVQRAPIAIGLSGQTGKVEIKSNVLFQSGEAVLSREAGAILAQLTRVVEITKNATTCIKWYKSSSHGCHWLW